MVETMKDTKTVSEHIQVGVSFCVWSVMGKLRGIGRALTRRGQKKITVRRLWTIGFDRSLELVSKILKKRAIWKEAAKPGQNQPKRTSLAKSIQISRIDETRSKSNLFQETHKPRSGAFSNALHSYTGQELKEHPITSKRYSSIHSKTK